MHVPSLTADLDVQHMQISNQGPLFSFLLLFLTEPGKENWVTFLAHVLRASDFSYPFLCIENDFRRREKFVAYV